MAAELLVAVVVVALDGSILDCAVHSLDLSVRPGMVHLGQAVLDPVVFTDPVEDVLKRMGVFLAVGELDAVVRQDGMDPVGDRRDQVAQELGGGHLTGLLLQPRESEFAGPVDGNEQVEFSFVSPELCDVDVEVADRIALELLPRWLIHSSKEKLVPLMSCAHCHSYFLPHVFPCYHNIR